MKTLINLLERKKNTKVLVNGTIYAIGPDGLVNDVEDVDAEKLLQNERVWKVYDAKRVSAQRAQAKKEFSGKMRLLDVNGNPVGKLPSDTPGPSMDPLDEVYARLDSTSEGPPPVPDSVGEELEGDSEEETLADELGDAIEEEASEEGAPLIEDDSDDTSWPDPDNSMSIEYLREMAVAYEVNHTNKTSKASLIKKITAAMYGE